jgi:hypothetical protein
VIGRECSSINHYRLTTFTCKVPLFIPEKLP